MKQPGSSSKLTVGYLTSNDKPISANNSSHFCAWAKFLGQPSNMKGLPSNGKGTISEKLVAEFGYEHISTGDLLREIDKTTPLGKEVDFSWRNTWNIGMCFIQVFGHLFGIHDHLRIYITEYVDQYYV